jgi:hypothetical protein
MNECSYGFARPNYPRSLATHWAAAHLQRARALAADGQWPKACDECASALTAAPADTNRPRPPSAAAAAAAAAAATESSTEQRGRSPPDVDAGPDSDVRAQVLLAYCEAMAKRTNLKAVSHWEYTRHVCTAAKRTPRGAKAQVGGGG